MLAKKRNAFVHLSIAAILASDFGWATIWTCVSKNKVEILGLSVGPQDLCILHYRFCGFIKMITKWKFCRVCHNWKALLCVQYTEIIHIYTLWRGHSIISRGYTRGLAIGVQVREQYQNCILSFEDWTLLRWWMSFSFGTRTGHWILSGTGSFCFRYSERSELLR